MNSSNRQSLASAVSIDDHASHYSEASFKTPESSKASINLDLVREIQYGGWIRKKVFDITQGSVFNNFILAIILLNSVMVALETSDYYQRNFDIFSAFGTVHFQDVDPRRFGSLFRTGFQVFAIMSQDTWTEIYQQNAGKSSIILFVAVFVNNLQFARQSNQKKSKKDVKLNEMDALEMEVAEVSEEQIAIPRESDMHAEGIIEEEDGIDNFYSPNLAKRQKELLGLYFRLLSALELNEQLHQRQKKVLDDLVDLGGGPAKLAVS
ncbi:hypothetical protein HDU67_000995 [Dinochytrium kinnereticum]|nr:hypothetical protein HDU67_000995 [Dinochytrium kinnereticum]